MFIDDSSSCGLKHREIRSDNGKQPLPINPFGTVAYAFTDNVSRNSCILKNGNVTLRVLKLTIRTVLGPCQ